MCFVFLPLWVKRSLKKNFIHQRCSFSCRVLCRLIRQKEMSNIKSDQHTVDFPSAGAALQSADRAPLGDGELHPLGTHALYPKCPQKPSWRSPCHRHAGHLCLIWLCLWRILGMHRRHHWAREVDTFTCTKIMELFGSKMESPSAGVGGEGQGLFLTSFSAHPEPALEVPRSSAGPPQLTLQDSVLQTTWSTDRLLQSSLKGGHFPLGHSDID